jgi:thioredoxin reductase
MEIPPAAVGSEDFYRINVDLKRASRIPVIAFGRIGPPDRAEDMLRKGEADLIGMARQLIADPDTPNKVRAGRVHLIRLCISCNDACVFQVGQEKAVRCVHNPGAGREREVNERFLAAATSRRHVVVVGGGPAGLKVAETAARRGHRVTLVERNPMLGGQVVHAAKQPEHHTIIEVTRYLEAMILEHGVEVYRNTTATPQMLRDLGADAIVVATGSEPNLPGRNQDDGRRSRSLGRQVPPAIAGLEQSFVISSDQAMSGELEVKGSVLVIDNNGHWEAAGTAEYLAEQGCAVEVVASFPVVGSDIEAGNRTLFYRRAAIKGIKLRPNTVVTVIGDHRVKIADVYSSADADGWGKYLLVPGEERWLDNIDWVVPVIGRRSREDLFLELKSLPEFRNIRIERTGDCVAPRLIEATIAEAFLLAQTL